ncbi:PREDICTED: probable serine/threonine-protein kinase pats1, partial [Amphimedon queenslandica]|uniref:COR domain-containing protein n=1 Tax=Amphimedon queenslandica TaxID=400682 RepID=A0AAN0JXU9_AMPQE
PYQRYQSALKEQGSADVAYARLMLLGSAGTGKTSLKRSLMEEPFNPHTTSTIVSDVSSVRPFGHKWQTRGNKWSEATEEDEIKELARLFKSSLSESSSHVSSESSLVSDSLDVSPAKSSAKHSDLDAKIKSLLKRVRTYQTTESHVQPFLHIWDCGGQPVYLEILPAFLTPRTMFLLLFDASKDFKEKWQSRQNTPDGEVHFGEVVNESTSDLMAKWMSTIHSYLVKHSKVGSRRSYFMVEHNIDDTPSPSLYCVGTRGDKLNEEKKEEVKKQMQLLYQEKEFSDLVQDVLIIDNTTSGKGEEEDPSITKLRGAIDGFINKLVVKTPVNWVLFRKVLQELKQNVISLSDAIAIGEACHIPTRDVPLVLKFYHELGVLLFYPKIKSLTKKVILSPKWFVDTVGKVFPLEKGWSGGKKWYLLRNKGILVQPLYQEVWQSSGIDSEEIIELLVHFRLAAQVQTELYDSTSKQYFLPAVLPGYTGDPNESQPGYKLRASPVHITFSTGYVPPGFFTRLATAVATDANVKLNFDKDYAAPDIHSKCIYRNRVCFFYGRPSDDFILTDVNTAIQVDVFRYVPESSHPVPFKAVCQQILELLNECCQKVEDTLDIYHGYDPYMLFGLYAYQKSSRRIKYVCQCSPSSEVHYIQDIDAVKQTCSDLVFCIIERRIPRPLTINESMWFKGNFSQEKHQEIPHLEKINDDSTSK